MHPSFVNPEFVFYHISKGGPGSGDFSHSGRPGIVGGSGKGTEDIHGRIHKTTDKIRNLTHEEGMLFDKNGKLLYHEGKEGDVYQFEPSPEFEEKLHGNIFVHNHPVDLPFSEADMETAFRDRPAEMQVVTHKNAYILDPGPKGWTGDGTDKPPNAKQLHEFWKVRDDAIKEMKEKYHFPDTYGPDTPDFDKYQDDLIRKIADHYGWKYTKKSLKELPQKPVKIPTDGGGHPHQ